MDGRPLATESTGDEVTRRRLIGLLAAGAAGTAMALAASDPVFAGHAGDNVLHLGEVNFPPLASGLQGRTDISADIDDFAVHIDNPHDGERAGGLYVTCRGGKPGIEVDVVEGSGVAVQGVAGCCEEFGTGSATGVEGITGTGIGVHAVATAPAGVALQVDGRAAFATAGAGLVPSGESSVFVANERVTDTSHVSVTLTSEPGRRQLHWVGRDPGAGFTVHMTPAPPAHRPATYFTYLISEAM